MKKVLLFTLGTLLIIGLTNAQTSPSSAASGFNWITKGGDLSTSSGTGGKITLGGSYINQTYQIGGDITLETGRGYSNGRILFKAWTNTAMEINSGGNVFVYTNLYVPKLFDQNNTAYYFDPSSTTISLKVAGNIQTCGKIEAEEVEVKNVCAANINVKMDNLADYVFKPEYKLASLYEVESFIEKNNHLPEMPSAEKVKANGLNVAEMNNLLLQKVEELTLYIIEQNKRIEVLESNTH